jgi:hypothetical protein
VAARAARDDNGTINIMASLASMPTPDESMPRPHFYRDLGAGVGRFRVPRRPTNH